MKGESQFNLLSARGVGGGDQCVGDFAAQL